MCKCESDTCKLGFRPSSCYAVSRLVVNSHALHALRGPASRRPLDRAARRPGLYASYIASPEEAAGIEPLGAGPCDRVVSLGARVGVRVGRQGWRGGSVGVDGGAGCSAEYPSIQDCSDDHRGPEMLDPAVLRVGLAAGLGLGRDGPSGLAGVGRAGRCTGTECRRCRAWSCS